LFFIKDRKFYSAEDVREKKRENPKTTEKILGFEVLFA